MSDERVPKGYKNTEVGVIPEDWDICSIQHLVEEGIIEKPLDGNHGDIHPKSNDFVPFGIPFIMSNNVKNGCIDTKKCSFIRKEQADKLQKGFSFEGDVLLTHKGTVGNVAIVSNVSTEYIMLTPQVTYYRVKNSEKLINTFIKFYFESNLFQTNLEYLSGGGTRAYIGITNQRKLPFLLPPLPEQKAIATTLSNIDNLITALDKLIGKKRDIKTATMQQLLTGKKRLPGFGEGKGYQNTEIGMIPEDWGVVCIIKATSQIFLGLTTKVDYVNSGGIPLIRASNIAGGRLSFAEARTISVRQHNELTKYRRPKRGDVLVSKSGSLGVCAIVDVDIEFSVYESIIVIQVNNLLNSDFILWLIRDEQTQSRVVGEKVGSTVGHLNLEMFRKLIIPLPPLPEQKAIATILSNQDEEITALEKRLTKTKAIKQGMMQELLTGKTRLINN